MFAISSAYIQENALFDDMYEFLEQTDHELCKYMAEYKNKVRQLELHAFFENASDVDMYIEAEGQNVFAKIGSAVIALIKKIQEFLKGFTDKIFGQSREIKSDAETVSKMISQNPELGKQIAEGIEKEWFTYKDVAQFEKDVAGLITMLKQKKLDNRTFMEKFKDKVSAFNQSSKVILAGGATVVGIIKLIPNLGKACTDCKKTLQGFEKTLEEFKGNVDTNYGKDGVSYANAVTNALAQAVGLTTKEAEARAKGQHSVGQWLKNLRRSTDEKKQDARDRTAKRETDLHDSELKKFAEEYRQKREKEMNEARIKLEIDKELRAAHPEWDRIQLEKALKKILDEIDRDTTKRKANEISREARKKNQTRNRISKVDQTRDDEEAKKDADDYDYATYGPRKKP